MQTKGLIFVFCLLASTFLQANNSPNPLNPSSIPTQAEFACNIPAPTNFHVEQVGTTSVKLAWNYQADASGGYRIRTYRASDNLLVNTTYRSQDQLFATINGLESGVDYVSYINCRCENGGNSGLNDVLQVTTLIIDLIVQGYQAPIDTDPLCEILVSEGECPFEVSDAIFHFKVVPDGTNINRQFGIQRIVQNNRTRFKVHLREDNTGQDIKLYCNNYGVFNEPTVQGCGAPLITVKYNNAVIAEFKIGVEGPSLSPSALFICTAIQDCVVSQVDQNGSGYQADPGSSFEGIRAGTSSAETNHPATTSPNPFTETLQVFLANQTAENVRMQLFNLNGQLVLDQPFAEGAGQYELATSHLSPGFYFLRIEADGEVQTLKVIKSE